MSTSSSPSSAASPPWSPGAATGIGSLPYDDPLEACRVVFGELGDLPHLPELPGRGPGAGMIGRACGLLVELGVDLQPSGWRLTGSARRSALDQRRAIALLGEDLDALELVGLGFVGLVKLQVTGPLTLAAAVERPAGGAVVGDPGARRDLTQSLAEGVAEHVRAVARRLPRARLLVQLDEPSLPAVLAGRIRVPSGLTSYRPMDEQEAVALLGSVFSAAVGASGPAGDDGSAGDDGAAYPLAHCCAPDPPLDLFVRAGARAVSYDLDLVPTERLDRYAQAVDEGIGLFVGAVPSRPDAVARSDVEIANRVLRWWRDLGYAETDAAARLVVTPACGLAGVTPDRARMLMTRARDVAAHVADRPVVQGDSSD